MPIAYIYRIATNYVSGLWDLLFPPLCVGCERKLVQSEAFICTFCFSSFPETSYHRQPDNAMFYRVIEDVAIADAFALYWLRKKSLLERVLVAMKYKNQPNIGLFLGRYYATMLAQTSLIQTIEGIVPIPLHRRRLQERGYNQSGFFAQGLAEVLQIPCYSACVERIRYTPSQTKKSKEERKANLQGVFRVMHPELIQGKHLLLVDDIFTTGATLVSCAKEVLAEGAGPVSMATIAIVEA
ncbi:hypothetical protein DK880_00974 [Candidatus Cardinium hertigii]|uniref:Phosphoribosyltransferase domain-containing protein n=2 Tax=Candidatus Cardinium hertigii TaxID=247481 RepID=A0A2Z3LAC2_9BACT|nr:hypothetical protein DK880_00974 [Candidatus Cardinium hertigii]